VKRRTVILAPEAVEDLRKIYDWIADRTSELVAKRYVDRIQAFCAGFDNASERGHKRDDIRPGLRVAGFELRLTIAFTVDADLATILRIFYGGQDWERMLAN
jgi:toxin ParE1/3/4